MPSAPPAACIRHAGHVHRLVEHRLATQCGASASGGSVLSYLDLDKVLCYTLQMDTPELEDASWDQGTILYVGGPGDGQSDVAFQLDIREASGARYPGPTSPWLLKSQPDGVLDWATDLFAPAFQAYVQTLLLDGWQPVDQPATGGRPLHFRRRPRRPTPPLSADLSYWDVILLSEGYHIPVMKALRALTGCSLFTAINLSNGNPMNIVLRTVSYDQALAAQTRLAAAGGDAKIIPAAPVGSTESG